MRTTAESPTTWLAVLDRGSKPALLGIESGFPIWILSGASYASPALGTTLAGCRTRCVFCKACGYRTFLARHSCDCTYSLLLTNIARVWYRFACSLEQTLYTSPVIPALTLAFSYYCRLFCAPKKVNSFIIKQNPASFCKTPGVGVSSQDSRLESAISSLVLALSAFCEGFSAQLQRLQLDIRRRMRILSDHRESKDLTQPFLAPRHSWRPVVRNSPRNYSLTFVLRRSLATAIGQHQLET